MTLEEAVDLVLFAFENGESGDIFVQKAPACTIEILAKAVKELFKADNEIKVIGSCTHDTCLLRIYCPAFSYDYFFHHCFTCTHCIY